MHHENQTSILFWNCWWNILPWLCIGPEKSLEILNIDSKYTLGFIFHNLRGKIFLLNSMVGDITLAVLTSHGEFVRQALLFTSENIYQPLIVFTHCTFLCEIHEPMCSGVCTYLYIQRPKRDIVFPVLPICNLLLWNRDFSLSSCVHRHCAGIARKGNNCLGTEDLKEGPPAYTQVQPLHQPNILSLSEPNPKQSAIH